MSLQNYPNNINLSQQQAVNHRGSHLLIVAGPGTGKTHTLTFRMIETVKRLKDHEKVLAITFTNKAAGEMRSRLNKRLWNAEDKTTIGTFHSFCLQFLRQYHDAANLPKEFRVIAPEECESISKELWPNQKQGARNKILERISEWKAIEFDEAPIAEVAVYNRKLREAGLLDFDDLLFETVRLLQGDSRILSEVQTTYPYVFVDEYQDINAIQQALLKILVGPQVELTAIGDPNQAIYGFRGSDVKFFENFAEDFPGTLTMSLSENYRSAQNLLSASGQVMAKSKSVYVPELTAKIYAQGQLTIYEAATDKAEAEYVVHQIEKMVGGLSMFSQYSGRVAREQESKRGCGEIAVLYRLNSQRLALQEAFDRSGIPYHVSGPKSEDLVDQICPERFIDIEVDAEKVSLMTIHAAKGLEFPVVFIIGCEQDILPLNLQGMEGDIEEERRLFYVGMTRAKEELFLLHARSRRLYGKTLENSVSPFLLDIEERLKEYDKLAEKPKKPPKEEDRQLTLF